MFTIKTIDLPDHFAELQQSAKFEQIAKGRQGAILIDITNSLIPLVRTTTIYKNPAQYFKPIHRLILSHIPEYKFNNAMIEIYDDQYRTMGYHSDQALDLDPNSYIAIYSCYADPSVPTRTLEIQNKKTKLFQSISLTHNSVVLFDLNTNTKHLHRIIATDAKNKWLGITFRLSKTLLYHSSTLNILLFPSGKPLRLASEEEKKEFYKLRGEENKSANFEYPELDYTINPSDLVMPF